MIDFTGDGCAKDCARLFCQPYSIVDLVLMKKRGVDDRVMVANNCSVGNDTTHLKNTESLLDNHCTYDY